MAEAGPTEAVAEAGPPTALPAVPWAPPGSCLCLGKLGMASSVSDAVASRRTHNRSPRHELWDTCRTHFCLRPCCPCSACTLLLGLE